MGVNTKSFDNASDMITFSRASGGYGFTKVSYGPELVTNGDFSTDSDWTKGGSWTISSGVATQPSGASAEYLVQADILTIGKVYEYSVEVTSANGSNFPQLYTEAGAIKSFGSGADTYTGIFVAAGNDVRIRGVSPTLDVSVDNISVKEVTYNSSDPSATLKLIYHPNDVPRIEYDLDGTAKGLLVEESRTNNITNSESCSFVDESGGTVTASTTPAPYGMSSTVKRVQSSTLNGGGRLQVTILTGGNNYCSVYVRSRTGADQDLKITASGTTGATQVAPASGDWVRLGRVASLGAGNRDMRVLSTGDTIDLDIALPQVELGSFPTSYIKTTGATATRSTDIASIPVADFGFHPNSKGTLFVEVKTPEVDQVIAGVALFNSTSYFNNAGFNKVNASNITAGGRYLFAAFDGETTNLNVTDANTGNFVKLAGVFGDGMLAVADGGAVLSGTERTPVPTHLRIGGRDNGYQSRCHIKSIKYYPRRLTDAQLQELTT